VNLRTGKDHKLQNGDWNAMVRRRDLLGALFILALMSQAALHASEPFEGVWAKTQAECRDEEGPNSRTLIDLGNIIDGKPAPIFDQYEHHCRIDRTSAIGGRTRLAATCFEFREDFAKGAEGKKTTIKLAPARGGTLKIDGALYKRCAVNGARASREAHAIANLPRHGRLYT
jgi:hypothetical protein